jgi:hypothetical protein
MIKEALEYLVKISLAAAKPTQVDTGDPTKITMVIAGQTIEIDKPCPPRDHLALNLVSMISLADRWSEVFPSLWVNEEEVVLLIDDQTGHRVNRVVLPLEKSDVFLRLSGLSNSWLDQRGFIKLLRVDLADSLAPGILLDKVRKIRFENGQVTTQESLKNRESMGKQIIAAVSTDGEIPEEVSLEISVFKGIEKFLVRCSVDVDPARGLFQLAPFPDEIERVVDLALLEIQGRLFENVAETTNVYMGRP